ncbi:hypothetical protein JK358_07725 [Nocardia sp. 2]|uniref:MFS transporter n=1 Tax=Nocardia acididurans TaxID=2802282 RepID=A0ABS1M244_9NOCA|nr:hypothetical protein [Nocardia acididurans]MBL1074284.1 hypothetical protein [Nocardia acididurans]
MAHPEAGLVSGKDSSGAPASTRGLLPLLFTGNAAMYAVYVGVPMVLLPLQIERIDRRRF